MSSDARPGAAGLGGVLLRGGAVVFLGTVAGFGLNFATRVVLARHFGQSNFGVLSVSLGVVMVLASVSSLGLESGIARFVPFLQGRGRETEVAASVAAGRRVLLIVAPLAATSIYLGAPFLCTLLDFPLDRVPVVRNFAFIVPLLILLNYHVGVLRGLKDMASIAWVFNVLRLVVRLAAVLLIVLVGGSLEAVPLAYALGLAVALIVVARRLDRSRLPPVAPPGEVAGSRRSVVSEDSSPTRQLVRHSLPLALSVVVTQVRRWWGVLFLGFSVTPAAVGVYAAAEPLAQLLTLFLFSANRIVLPVATLLLGKGQDDQVRKVHQDVSLWTTAAVLPALFALLLFPAEILSLFYGSEYSGGSGVLRILALGMFVNASTGPYGELLQAHGRTEQVLSLAVVGTLLNVFLVWGLVPIWGIVGAAAGVAASTALTSTLGVWMLYQLTGCQPFSPRYLKMFALGSLVLGNGAWAHLFDLGPWNGSISTLFFVGVVGTYVGVLRLAGIIGEVELETMRAWSARWVTRLRGGPPGEAGTAPR